MHRRYDTTNIPIELLRTLVAVSDLGTLTKAADALNLTQPAISAQIKRLQQIVGSDVLEKWGAGVRPTVPGGLVVNYARRILAMNDQILLQSRSKLTNRTIRIGLSPICSVPLLSRVLKALSDVDAIANFRLECARSTELHRRLAGGYVDVAVLPFSSNPNLIPRNRWTEKMIWACAPNFLLSPGKPIPLIGWPGSASHQFAIEALDRAGVPYTFTFVTDDWTARVAALHAGLGYIAIPETLSDPSFKVAREHYLPPLPDLLKGVFVRDDAGSAQFDAVAEVLNDIFKVEARRVEDRKTEIAPRPRGGRSHKTMA